MADRPPRFQYLGVRYLDPYCICKESSTDNDIVDMASQPVVCQKSDLFGSSDFRNSQKVRPFTNTV